MDEYHKILTVFARDPATKHRTLLDGQYALSEFEYLRDNEWVFTEKVDGTNIRVMYDGVGITFGGKTKNAQLPAQLVTALRKMFVLGYEEARMVAVSDGSFCLYGEGYGAKIQKGGGNYRPDQSFVLFDVKIGDWWLQRSDVEDVAKKLGVDVVPIVGRGTLPEMVAMVREGFHSQWGDFRAEGLVARPATELKTRAGKRLITKIKCKDFVR